MRTLNGETLIDDNGDLNESVWLGSLLVCAQLLKHNDKDDEQKDREVENESNV